MKERAVTGVRGVELAVVCVGESARVRERERERERERMMICYRCAYMCKLAGQ